VRLLPVIAAFSTATAIASSVSAIVFAVCTIARWMVRTLLRLLGLLGDRELAADLLRLGEHRHAAQERQDRELGPGSTSWTPRSANRSVAVDGGSSYRTAPPSTPPASEKTRLTRRTAAARAARSRG
jgi:hypothetical protein